jgi:ferritin-like metal-binding protein YciE
MTQDCWPRHKPSSITKFRATARSRHAAVLGLSQVASLLEATLSEEKKTNDALTKLAESGVNEHAQAA